MEAAIVSTRAIRSLSRDPSLDLIRCKRDVQRSTGARQADRSRGKDVIWRHVGIEQPTLRDKCHVAFF